MIEHRPILFNPFFKHVIWGGTKICHLKGIPSISDNIGESWEISSMPGQESTVCKGQYSGLTLSELVDRFGEDLLGKKVMKKYDGKFPLLIKLIDANDRLSVQVHPDDDLARQRHGSLGKSELWYILSAEKGAKIYVGFKECISPEDFPARVADGTFTDALAESESNAGDVFFLPAGRVHAIGAGNLLVEIQQSSDITYRIFDYNRKDKDGNARELHTEEARNAIDYTVYDTYKSPPADPDKKENILISCDHFTTSLIRIDTPTTLPSDPDSFTVIICIEGEVTLSCSDGEETITAGHTLLVPAIANKIKVTGEGTILATQA